MFASKVLLGPMVFENSLIIMIHRLISENFFSGCSLGTVFNVESLQCDDPENVAGW